MTLSTSRLAASGEDAQPSTCTATTTAARRLLERLRPILAYDPETGIFTWRVTCGGRAKVGSVAGGKDAYGYMRIGVFGVRYKSHRLAWLFTYGDWPPDQIDHVNCEPGDNRLANLRAATQIQNSQNRRRQQGANPFLGVCWHKQTGSWSAQIKANGRKKHLGSHATPEAAHAAYLEAKRALHPFGML